MNLLKSRWLRYGLMVISAGILGIASNCSDDDDDDGNGNGTQRTSFFQVNAVVPDTTDTTQAANDTLLEKPWGLAVGPNGTFWFASDGKVVVLNDSGREAQPPIAVAGADSASGARVTGVVVNPGNLFVVPGTTTPAKVFFSTDDGTIAAWVSGTSAVTVASDTAGKASYKGLTIINNKIYAANFKKGRVDVYDTAFKLDTSISIRDTAVQSGFAPINVVNIDNKLYVAYAKRTGSDSSNFASANGTGFITVYNENGTIDKRFTSGGTLNAPWAIVKSNGNYGSLNGNILVGNLGDGRINVFDNNGSYKGQFGDSSGTPITIKGLKGLAFKSGTNNRLYFTADTTGNGKGTFGFVEAKSK